VFAVVFHAGLVGARVAGASASLAGGGGLRFGRAGAGVLGQLLLFEGVLLAALEVFGAVLVGVEHPVVPFFALDAGVLGFLDAASFHQRLQGALLAAVFFRPRVVVRLALELLLEPLVVVLDGEFFEQLHELLGVLTAVHFLVIRGVALKLVR